MTVRQPRYSKEEHARRGNEIYERLVRPQVESGNYGKIVALDIDTGAFVTPRGEAKCFVATDHLQSSRYRVFTHEQLFDLGKRMADERIAGLILRLMDRLDLRGEIHDQSFPFPLRQQHIADITGLTPVHVSRVIGTFRKRGLLDIAGGVVTIRDLPELRRVGGLN